MDDICPHCKISIAWEFMKPKEVQEGDAPPKTAYICPHCAKRFVENTNRETKWLEYLGLLLVLPTLVAIHYRSVVAMILGVIVIVAYAVYAQHLRSKSPKVYAKYRELDE